jgi:DNA invertase Pin-like site-specific DNA recombinase
MRAALYARVSTEGQHPEAQLAELRAYAQRRGFEAHEFVDEGVSGRRRSRPEFDAMMRAARRREIDIVVVARLDRLARSLAHMAQLGEELRDLGVELVSLHEAIDTSTAMGEAMFGMCGVFAQLEVSMLRERTRAGLAVARSHGKSIGRPRALDSRGVARVRRLRAAGKTVREVAELLGVSPATIVRAARGHR